AAPGHVDRARAPRRGLLYGHAGFAKRGEDYFLVKPDCPRVPGDPSTAPPSPSSP
ncbi:hypothetical protein CFC21_021590, partial [Triticum aestivum]